MRVCSSTVVERLTSLWLHASKLMLEALAPIIQRFQRIPDPSVAIDIRRSGDGHPFVSLAFDGGDLLLGTELELLIFGRARYDDGRAPHDHEIDAGISFACDDTDEGYQHCSQKPGRHDLQVRGDIGGVH